VAKGAVRPPPGQIIAPYFSKSKPYFVGPKNHIGGGFKDVSSGVNGFDFICWGRHHALSLIPQSKSNRNSQKKQP